MTDLDREKEAIKRFFSKVGDLNHEFMKLDVSVTTTIQELEGLKDGIQIHLDSLESDDHL